MSDTVVVVQDPVTQIVVTATPTPAITIAALGPQGPIGPVGPIGPPGAGAAVTTFVFTQSSASSSWLITHNLGQYPSVSVVDSAGTLVDGDVTYLDSNRVRIDFSAAFGGTAYLN